MAAGGAEEPIRTIEALNVAMNARDIEAFIGLFAEAYESEQPNHPDRAFQGRNQVRANWSAIFDGVPDFTSELLRVAADGETVWSEWLWQGTQRDGTPLEMASVIICGVQDSQIAWGRLYVEPVEQAGDGIEAAVRDMSGGE